MQAIITKLWVVIVPEIFPILSLLNVSPVRASKATTLNIEVMTYTIVDSTSIGCTTIKAVVDMTLIPVKNTKRKILHIVKVWSVFFLNQSGRQRSSGVSGGVTNFGRFFPVYTIQLLPQLQQ